MPGPRRRHPGWPVLATMRNQTVWTPEVVDLEPAAVQAAYVRVRDAIASDPLFAEDAARYGVSIDTLDVRQVRARRHLVLSGVARAAEWDH